MIQLVLLMLNLKPSMNNYKENIMSQIQPVSFSDYLIKTDDEGNDWIVNKSSGAAYMSLSALASCAETGANKLSEFLSGATKCPEGLSSIDFSGVLRIENPDNSTPWVAVPAQACHDIIFYYAYEARGNEQRIQAKSLAKAMGGAGAAVFIYGKAGYEIKPAKGNRLSQLRALAEVVTRMAEQEEELERLALEQSEVKAAQQQLAVQATQQQAEINAISAEVKTLTAAQQELDHAITIAKDYLASLDGVQPLQLSARAQLNVLVRAYQVVSDEPYGLLWNKVYSAFAYSKHINLKTRASNRGVKPLDYAEREGLLDDLLAVALSTLVG